MNEKTKRDQRLDRIDKLCRILPPPWSIRVLPLDEAADELQQYHEDHEHHERDHMRPRELLGTYR
jgi:hypothetical protein